MRQANITDVVDISTTDLTEVNIRRDFNNSNKIAGYIPNEASRRTMKEIFSGLMPTSTKRVHLITGSYGTGKSHFGLVLTALLRKYPIANKVLSKVREKDDDIFRLVKRNLDATKKFLVVVPDITSYPNGFNRALLVALQDALKQEGIDFRPNSYYEAALKCIERWEKDGAENTEDNPYRKLGKALIHYGKTPEILRDGLRKCSDEDLEIFKKVHEEVSYGAVFQPDATASPAELYGEVIEYLKGTDTWDGVWVFCDEFGRYLSILAKDPNSWESQNIQQFAEYCKRGGENQCHFVVIAHQTLADYAIGFRDKKEWEKISGRFIGNEYSLENIRARYETVEMISTIITSKKDTANQKQLWEKITEHPDFQILSDDLKNIGVYRDQSQSWLKNTLIKGCFPLHPLATFSLPLLAQKVGQRERTLFTFFNDDDENGLRRFVNENHIQLQKRLNFFTLDRLIHYFGPAAENNVQYKHIMQARRDAIAQVSNNPLAHRIIDTICVLEILGAENLQPSDSVLFTVLHLPASESNSVQQVTTELINEKILRRRANNLIELRQRKGEYDITEAINKEKDELRPTFNALESLKEIEVVHSKLLPLLASAYEKKHFVRRLAVRQFANIGSLSNPKEYMDRIERWYKPNRKQYEGDIQILYILAEGNDEIRQAKRYADMEEYKHPQLIFAIPKQPIQLTETLLSLAAAEAVKNSSIKYSKDDADVEELDIRIKDLQSEISRDIDDFIQANRLIWYCNGNVTSTLDRGGEEDFISNILESRFSKTPAVRDDSISNIISGRDTTKKDRHSIMDILLENKGRISVKKAQGTAVDRIIRSCLVDTEILEKKEDKGAYADYDVRKKLPKGAVLEDVWSWLAKKLFRQDSRIELEDIVTGLLKPPYGLSHQLVELLLASFFRNFLDEFVIFENYQESKKRKDSKLLRRITLNAQTIGSIVLNPDNYVALYYEIRPSEREYVNRVIKLLKVEDVDSGEMGIWERGRDALIKWFALLPPITTHTNLYSSDLTSGLVDLLRNPDSISDAKELFRNQLPSVLDIELTTPPTEPEIEDLLARLESCYLELENYADIRARVLVNELAKIYDSKGTTREDLSTAIREWYNTTLSESQRLHTFGGDAGSLKRAVEAEGPVDKRLLDDLPDMMGLGSYKAWIESSTSDLFLTRVKLAKLEVEQWQSIPTGAIPKKGKEEALQDIKDVAKDKILTLLSSLDVSKGIKIQILKELLGELDEEK